MVAGHSRTRPRGVPSRPGDASAGERHLQLANQSAIDIAMHVLAEDSAETPEDYGAAFTLLARHGVLDDNLANRLSLAAGLRNILVHGYLDVDP
ncbi:MAG TPA: HepT-like ribonuclease domain-containing protein [Egibacteraceae bacterium]|nr:HepT-like ribonuclease domain-containing protein [Egibacteraceae bacterium]